MRIVCPSCSATYDVPDALLRGRRTVRCAACSREWNLTDTAPPEPESLFRPEPPPAEEVLEGTAEPVPHNRLEPPRREGIPREAIARAIAMDRLQNAPPPRKGGLGLAVAWVLSFAVLAALAWSAYDYRIAVMNAWPPSIRLYTLLGLA